MSSENNDNDDTTKEEKRKKEKEKDKDQDKKPIVMGANDIQGLVISSVSDLMDKGILAESEDGRKIDLKKNIEPKKKKIAKEEEDE